MNDALSRWLLAAGGQASVESVMAEALYGAGGYYSQHIKAVGRGGDFATSATLNSELARAVAAWILAQMQKLGDRPVSVIEIGAGSGHGALGILQALGWWTRRQVRYRIVEISPRLREAQQFQLKRYSVQWHTDVKEALQAANGVAILISNELVDAFPCVSVVWEDGAWRERLLDARGAHLSISVRELDMDRVRRVGGGSALTIPELQRDGQQIELHLSYAEWLREWAPSWKAGAMLTVDYGGDALELYRRRRLGSMRAYCLQQRFDGRALWDRFGMQDLTADVNFVDLKSWGEALGWRTDGIVTQREFALQWSKGLEGRAAKDQAIQRWLDDAGAGGAFKVLMQSRTHPLE